MTFLRRAMVLAALCAAAVASAGPDEDWAAVTALDRPPTEQPATKEAVRAVARTRFAAQRKALDAFLASNPDDARVVVARIRIAGILAAEGRMDSDSKRVEKAIRTLAEIEADATLSENDRATAGFVRVSISIQDLKGDTGRVREAVATAARNYCAKHPTDRRGPRLLVEAATLCDDAPTLKRSLLEQARAATTEEPLRARIADDFARLDRLGALLELRLTTPAGAPFEVSSLRGNVVAVIFWSAESPHSLVWLRDFLSAAQRISQPGPVVVAVSLDEKRAEFAEKSALFPPGWRLHFDGKGWESPVARTLGINALPSVWILDKKGVVRSINAKESYVTWIQRLQRENP